MTTVAIEVADIAKVYPTHEGKTVALSHLSFSVAPQEFVSVLGPSGCGKTTVLKIVAGLSRATSGQI
ncbi:MAG: ATP-binding cassette domain-containing protein, partial [Xanthobacteraceae bacterium]